MEAARARNRFPAAAWETRAPILHDPYLHQLQTRQRLAYSDRFQRTAPARSNGSLAGLVIGTIAGVVAALMLGIV